MKRRNHRRAVTPLVAMTFGLAFAAGQAGAQLLVYEGFQYGATGTNQVTNPADPNYNLLHTQPDGVGGDVDATGLGGTWQDLAGPGGAADLFLSPGNLSFADLASNGNHVRSDTNSNNDRFSRPITVSLSGGSELWFSVLASKLQNNYSAAEGGLVIGNQVVNNPRILLDDGTSGLAGFGVAPTTAGNNWTPYAWDGSSQTVGDAAYGVPTNGSQVDLLVGKIVFDAGAGGTDQYTLYYYDLTASGGSVVADEANLVAIASTIEVDVTQADLDTLSLTRQVNTAYDEIRIGGSLSDVVGAGADTTAPVLALPTSPADEAGNVALATDLVATFSEDIAAGSGNITIKNLTDATQVAIPVGDARVSISGTTLTINPTADLLLNKDYAVQIDAGAVVDLAAIPNAFTGILDDTTWNFTTVEELIPPMVSSTSPGDETTDVALDALLVVTFDEDIAAGTGNITIKNLTDGTQTAIAVGDAPVTVSGTDLTIDLAADLIAGKDYAIQIDAGAVTDLIGNQFAGISNDTDWNFSTVGDVVNPSLVLPTSPADNATGVPVATNLVATFDENIALGTGDITIKNLTDATQVAIPVGDAQVSVSGVVLTINPTGLLAEGKEFVIEIAATAVEDLAGNPYAGILDDTTWSFTTGTVTTGLLVYEGFQYADPATSDGLHGQPDDPGATDTDATGLTGLWNDALNPADSNNLFLKSNSLVFGDLMTAGNHVGADTNEQNDRFHRDLTSAAQNGVGGNPEIWFSIVAEKLQNDFSAAEGGLVLANQVVGNSKIPENDGTDGLQGFGVAPTTAGNDWTAYAWDGASQSVGDAALTVGVGSGDVRLLVGQISFDTGAGGTDEFTLYEYQLSGSNTIAGGTLSPIASTIEVDVDQGTLDTLNLTRQVNTNYDEIRIGTSQSDVLPGGGVVNNFASWIAMFPGAASDTSFGGDPDKDGIANGLENFFGTNPGVYTAGLSAGGYTTDGGNKFTFTHPQNADPAVDVSAPAYSWSTDLVDFYGDGASNGAGTTTVSFSPSFDDPTAGTTTVTATITGTVIPDRLFVDVGVTQLP